MKVLTIIMTHKEAKEAVFRHLLIWQKLGECIFVSPEDSPMNIDTGIPEVLIGQAEHHGEKSAQRIIKIFEYAIRTQAEKEWTHLLLTEYDAIALEITDDMLPQENGVSAILYKQNKPFKFKGKFYLHYPMLFTKGGLQNVYNKLPEVITNDRNYSDRFIGKAVELARIPVNDLRRIGKGYSKNTIEPKHYIELKEAINNGARFFHGIKTEEVLKIITTKWI